MIAIFSRWNCGFSSGKSRFSDRNGGNSCWKDDDSSRNHGNSGRKDGDSSRKGDDSFQNGDNSFLNRDDSFHKRGNSNQNGDDSGWKRGWSIGGKLKHGQHGLANAGVRAGDEQRLLHSPTSKRKWREITMTLKCMIEELVVSCLDFQAWPVQLSRVSRRTF